MGTAGVGVTEKEDDERRVDQQHVFHGVARFLAAITARLLSRILGALDAPFGPVVANRGEAGSDTAGSTGGGATGAARRPLPGLSRPPRGAAPTPTRTA
jgi:hypothetical protein